MDGRQPGPRVRVISSCFCAVAAEPGLATWPPRRAWSAHYLIPQISPPLAWTLEACESDSCPLRQAFTGSLNSHQILDFNIFLKSSTFKYKIFKVKIYTHKKYMKQNYKMKS